MAGSFYKINDECLGCGACEGECPVNAIVEGDGRFDIDQNICENCDPQKATCVDACQHGCIERVE